MSSFIFRGFIPASSSWVYWKTGEAQPDGATLISTAKTLVTTSVNFSQSLNPISDLSSSLQYNFEFTNGLVQTITNVTDSVSGFIVNGGSDVANGWKPLLLVSGSRPLSHFAFANSNNRKFVASGSAGLIFTGSFTLEALVKHNSSITTNWDLLASNYSNQSWSVWKIGSGNPNKIRIAFRDASSNLYETYTTSSLPLQKWVHLVCTREVVSSSSTFVTQSIYINGQIDARSTFILSNPQIFAGSQTFYIGGSGVTTDNWDGEMIYIRLYNKNFTTNDINQTYSSSLNLWQDKWLTI